MVEHVLAKDGIGVRFHVSAPREQSERGEDTAQCLRIVRGESKGGAMSLATSEPGPTVLNERSELVTVADPRIRTDFRVRTIHTFLKRV